MPIKEQIAVIYKILFFDQNPANQIHRFDHFIQETRILRKSTVSLLN